LMSSGKSVPPAEHKKKLERARKFVYGTGGRPIDVTPESPEERAARERQIERIGVEYAAAQKEMHDRWAAEKAAEKAAEEAARKRKLYEAGAFYGFKPGVLKIVIEGGDGATEGNTVRVKPTQ